MGNLITSVTFQEETAILIINHIISKITIYV